MAPQDQTQQGTWPKLFKDVEDGKVQPRFPGAARCWKKMCAMEVDKTRGDIARFSFHFASKRKRGTVRPRRVRVFPLVST